MGVFLTSLQRIVWKLKDLKFNYLYFIAGFTTALPESSLVVLPQPPCMAREANNRYLVKGD